MEINKKFEQETMDKIETILNEVPTIGDFRKVFDDFKDWVILNHEKKDFLTSAAIGAARVNHKYRQKTIFGSLENDKKAKDVSKFKADLSDEFYKMIRSVMQIDFFDKYFD